MKEDLRPVLRDARRRAARVITAAAALALLPPAMINAQSADDVLAAVRECQRIDAMSPRLACYDRAFPPAGESARSGAGSTAAAASSGQAPVAGAAGAAAASRVVETEARTARVPREEPPPVIADDGISTIAVVDVRSRRPGETIFYVDDGRVFMQNGGSSRLRVPDPPFDAELEPGAFGSTFLRLPDDGPRVRVTLRD